MAGKPIAAVLQAISASYGPLGELPIPPEGISEDDLRVFIGEPLTKFRFVVLPKEPAQEKPCAQTEREAVNGMLTACFKRAHRAASSAHSANSGGRETLLANHDAEMRHADLIYMLDRIATALEQSNKDYADMVQRT